jgi:plastocyanin
LSIGALVAVAVIAATTTFAQAANVSVDIVDEPRPQDKWGYAPAARAIAAGTWVTWSNSGYDAHSVTATDGAFDSGILNPSEGFSWYFDHDGTYEYLCSLHPWMTARIVVGDAAAPEATEPPEPEPEIVEAIEE